MKQKNKFLKTVNVSAYLDGMKQFLSKYSDKSDEIFEKSQLKKILV